MELLEKNPDKRLGFNGAKEIKNHKWFENISWDDLIEKNVMAPYIPSLKDKYDTSNFDEEFTN